MNDFEEHKQYRLKETDPDGNVKHHGTYTTKGGLRSGFKTSGYGKYHLKPRIETGSVFTIETLKVVQTVVGEEPL